MTAPRRYGLRSLRFKLVLASVVVEALMLTVLVWNSARITGESIQELLQHRVDVLVPLMNVSLASPLAQRDYATLDERLQRIVRKESLVYVEVRDELGRIAASRGDLPAVPHLDRSIESTQDVFDQEFDITLAGRAIGHARYGLNVSLLEATLTSLRNQGILVASAGIVLTVLLLTTLGALLTRHLLTLAQAARALQGGDYSTRVPAVGRDEVADTAQAFNAMADALARDITERRRTQQALQQSEQRLRDLIDGLGPQMFVGLMTPNGTLIEVNRPALAAAGLKPEDVLGKQVEQSYWWSYSEEAQQRLHATVVRAAQGEASRYDARVRVGANQFIYIDFSLQPLRDEAGRVQYLIGSANVITERKLAEQALRESEERLRLALDAAHMGTFDWDIPANRITWSRWHEELWGFQPGEFGGTYEAFSERVHLEDLPGINAEVARCIAAREPFTREFRVVWPDSGVHWISSRGEFAFDAGGEPVRMRGAVVEITERKRAEQTIQHLAYRDQLTGLSNRAAVQERLRQGLTEAKVKGQTLALLILDLNNFREVNDTLGHPVGDQVLTQVAARLKDILWESDMVARLAGDEFAVLLPRLADRSHIELVMRKIVGGFKAPFVVAEVPLDVQPSVGVALYPEHGTDADTLFQHADVALNAAKTQHQTHVIYTAAVDHYNPQQLRLMAELRAAIAQDELVLYYQPKLGLKNNDIIGVEALVRWRHPKRGLLPPMEFIPIAEKTGLIDDLTHWVIKAALQQAQQWHDIGFPIEIALNISARNLQDSDFVQQIMEMFSRTASDPKHLVFEITESAMMLDPVGAKRKLNELHRFGVSFAIDDFGTGYSSLGYLMELPVNQLKIDKSFVAHMAEPGGATIVRSTIDLAHNLNLSVIAEGVEQQWQADQLRDMGCDIGQGYYFSLPQPAEAITQQLTDGKTLPAAN